mmetsp:Transcript_52976/g.124094  ORF Transcript_52976/g.124094 Transcript_52976/m.124094 type:complete len:339 (+) Transcript_52976:98-1114(+)
MQTPLLGVKQQPVVATPPKAAAAAAAGEDPDEEEWGSETTPDDQPLGVNPVEFLNGLRLCGVSMEAASAKQKVLDEFRVFVQRTAILSASCCVFALICLIPLAIPVLILDAVFHLETHVWLLGTLCYFLVTLPQVQLFVARSLLYRRLDEVFFEALTSLDAKWAMSLEAMKPERRWRTLVRMAHKLIVVMLVLPALIIFSRMPYLGALVMPLFTVWHVRGWIGKKRAIVAALIMLVPSWREPCTVVVVLYREVMVLGRALLEPFFRRDKEARKEAGKFFAANEALILGFCFPLLIFTSLPIIGPATFVLAQAMSPTLLVNMVPAEIEAAEEKGAQPLP